MIQQLGDNLVPIVALVGGFLVGIGWILANTAEKISKTWMNNRLKTRLLDQGFSASEIRQIVNAGNPVNGSENLPANRPAPPVKPTPVFRHDA